MKKFFTILLISANFLALNAQDLLFDFSTKLPGGNWPWTTWGGISAVVEDDASSLGNKVAKITYTKDVKSGPGILLQTSGGEKFSRDAYAGFTMKVKSNIPASPGLIFTFTIEDGSASRGNWTTFPVYTGDGGWVTMKFPFVASMASINFDRIAINPTTNGALIPTGSVFYIDDITLVKEFTTSLTSEEEDNTRIFNENGILHVEGVKDNTGIKIYTTLGSLVYSGKSDTDFSINLSEYGAESGVLLVHLNDGVNQKVEKILYAR